MSDNHVDISVNDWMQHKSNVDLLKREVETHERRINSHSQRLDNHDLLFKDYTMLIKEAVEDGMKRVDTDILEINNKLHEMELERIRNDRDVALSRVAEEKSMKQWRNKLILGTTITAIISGVISFYILLILEKLRGG